MKQSVLKKMSRILVIAILAATFLPGWSVVQEANAEVISQTISLHPQNTTWNVIRANPDHPPIASEDISTANGGNAAIKTAVGDVAETTISVTQSASYRLGLDTSLTGHTGIFSVAIDGKFFKNEDGSNKEFDTYIPEGTDQTTLDLGKMQLDSGEHTLSIHVVGTSSTGIESSTGEKKARVYVRNLFLTEYVPQIDAISFTESEVSLSPGSSMITNLYGVLDNGDTADLSLYTTAYTSSDESVVTVNNDGILTANAAGSATVTATASSEFVTEQAELTVYVQGVNNATDSISVSAEKNTLDENETTDIAIALSSGESITGAVTYYSSNASVATVDSEGVVTGIKSGVTTIYTQVNHDEATYVDSVDITVITAPLASVIMTATTDYLTLDQTAQLHLRGVLEGGTEMDLTQLSGVTYSSEDEAVVTVDQAGKVTPVAQGYTNVTAAANIGGVTKKARIGFTVVGERIEGAWYPATDFSGIHELGSNNTGKLVVEYDATPMAPNIDGVMAFLDSENSPSKWGDLPIIVRMNMDGRFDARNGGSYEQLGFYEYRRGITYHFKIIIDLNAEKFGAWVTTPDGDTNLIAADYDFRSGAPVPDDLGKMLLKTKNTDALRVENVTVQPTTEAVPARPEPPELVPVTPSGNSITVNGFTGEAIQAAIDVAAPGDEIYLPAGTYSIKETIKIQKPIIMRGAAKLLNVGEIEWDIVDNPDNNIPPEWDSQPTELVYDESVPYTFDMIEVITENVRFEDIRFVGGLEDQDGYDQRTENIQSSIDLRLNGVELITGYGEVYGCEFTRHSQGLVMAGIGIDKTMIVRNSYFHENFRKHSGYGVVSESYGMGTLDVRESEFMRNRHDVIASTAINFSVIDNYMHTNDPVVREYSIDLHPAAYYDGRMVVRNNVMLNTGWVIFHAGSGEVTGNYFGPYENDYNPVYIGPGNKEVFLNQSKPHGIYIGRNTNATGKDYTVVDGVDKLAVLRHYDFDKTDNDPTEEYLAYNVFENGVLYESVYDQYETHTSEPVPKLGDMFVTDTESGEVVREIEKGKWYDLHAMAVDPQGADNIEKIGLQIRSEDYDYLPGNENGQYQADGNFFIEADETGLRVRETEGSSDWSVLTEKSVYVDGSASSFENDASHQKELTVRFKIPANAPDGLWYLNGYTIDKDGNLPSELEYYDQISWEVQVTQQIDPNHLSDAVQLAGERGWINNHGIQNSLQDKINQLLVVQDDAAQAMEALIPLENQIEALSGKKIDAAFAEQLLADIQALRHMYQELSSQAAN